MKNILCFLSEILLLQKILRQYY